MKCQILFSWENMNNISVISSTMDVSSTADNRLNTYASDWADAISRRSRFETST